MVEPYEVDWRALHTYRRSLQPDAARLGVELGDPHWDDDHYRDKIDLLLELRPDVVSFTFGCPIAEVLHSFKQRDVLSTVTVTSVAEARAAVARGAASLCIQGPDAGGHRGTWDLDQDPDRSILPDLLTSVFAVAGVSVLAGGGLAAAADVASVLARGAVAAQVGTAYLLCDEAGTNSVHRAAMINPAFARTYGQWEAAARACMASLVGSLADNKAALGRRYAEWAISAPLADMRGSGRWFVVV